MRPRHSQESARVGTKLKDHNNFEGPSSKLFIILLCLSLALHQKAIIINARLFANNVRGASPTLLRVRFAT